MIIHKNLYACCLLLTIDFNLLANILLYIYVYLAFCYNLVELYFKIKNLFNNGKGKKS